MEPVNYYEIPESEPTEKRYSLPRIYILDLYHRLRRGNNRRNSPTARKAKGALK